MRGHIRKRGDHSWAIIIEQERDPETGKRRQKWHSYKGTKKEAEKERDRLLYELDHGGYVSPQRITVSEFLKRWLEDYATTNTRPRTVDGYQGIVSRYITPAIGATPLQKLSGAQIQSIYAKMLARGLSPRTTLHTHRVLKEALSHAVKWGLVMRNVAEAVDPPRPERKDMVTLAPENIGRVLAAAEDTHYRNVIALAIFTGMRRSELVGLRWTDVDAVSGALSVTQGLHRVSHKGLVTGAPKTTRSRRRIALGADALTILRQQRARQAEQRLAAGPAWQDGEWVFTRPDGRPVDPDEVTHMFTRLVRELDLPGVRFHDLRHTHASLMLARGIHPKIVSERLGHASVTITLDTYSHVLPGLQEAAAESFEAGLRGYTVGVKEAL